jgi:amino acid transporter
MYFALANGGPAAWIFSYLVVAAGVLCQVATFSEMASIQPIAGAQYYWTWHFAPLALRRFLTWMQGWSTWTGYVALLASCLNGNTVILEGVIQLAHPEFETGGWRTTLIMITMVVFCAVINMYAFWLVPWFELLTGFLNVAIVLVIFVVLWAMAPRNNVDIFVQTNVSSGWDNYFVSANLGALSNIYLFICKSHLSCCRSKDLTETGCTAFESVVHMGEETRNAKSAVPFALFWSTVTNVAMGLIMIMTFAVSFRLLVY